MSKAKIIASFAASAVVAATPMALTFADTTPAGVTSGDGKYIDKLVVEVKPTCTFSRREVVTSDGGHTDGSKYSDATAGISETTTGNGAWTKGSGTGDAKVTDTLTGIIAGNSVDADFGSSHFNVICNNYNGWKVTATATALAGAITGNTKTIPNTGTSDVAAGTDGWSYTSTVTEGSTLIDAGGLNATIVAQSKTEGDKTTGNAGQNFDILYKVATSNSLPTDTYTGTVTYVFAQL